MANGPRVVVSIKPIHALVAGVMAGVGTPDLLVDGAVSEHEYALRPSQANVLSKADVIFWVGPQLESFLIRPLAALAPLAVQIALSKSPDVQLLPVRDADLLHTPPGAKNAPLYDMHIWLDPGNAGALVREISAQLQARDPANAAIYSRNALALEVRLNTSTQRISERLSALAVAPYIVFHDAYQYFEARFGLKPVAFVSIDHSRPPGAGRIRALRKQISESNVICVFAEPQFEPGLVETLVEGTAARAAVLDPLGAGLPEGVEMYFTLLDQLVQALENCSQPP
jgi:zinc transport system substrate-binding protein